MTKDNIVKKIFNLLGFEFKIKIIIPYIAIFITLLFLFFGILEKYGFIKNEKQLKDLMNRYPEGTTDPEGIEFRNAYDTFFNDCDFDENNKYFRILFIQHYGYLTYKTIKSKLLFINIFFDHIGTGFLEDKSTGAANIVFYIIFV